MKFKMTVLSAMLMAGAIGLASAQFNRNADQLLKDAQGGIKAMPALRGVAVKTSASEAVQPLFTREFHYSFLKDGTALARLGAQKYAEEAAVMACGLTTGSKDCAAIRSAIDCDRSACRVTAVARDLKTPPGFERVSVQGASSWVVRRIHPFDEYERLGIKKSAEDHARLNCVNAGLESCAARTSQFTSCDGYECTAAATAVGFKKSR